MKENKAKQINNHNLTGEFIFVPSQNERMKKKNMEKHHWIRPLSINSIRNAVNIVNGTIGRFFFRLFFLTPNTIARWLNIEVSVDWTREKLFLEMKKHHLFTSKCPASTEKLDTSLFCHQTNKQKRQLANLIKIHWKKCIYSCEK